ncbi:MAG TPA: TetR/AcrR family transcriptional regulator [Ramlibacter sp.]|nr:TetR/AcrR family transcriptional regulator [Ramlibacter sp.]
MPTPRKTPGANLSPQAKPRRTSGRPAADATVGRDVILDTTVRLLRTRTPEQLSILEIAAAAGVTRALVRYYFGDLKGLLRQVTEHLMRQLQDRMEAVLQTEGSVCDRLHHRLVLRLEFMREHPHFERLALSEIYHFDAGGEPEASGSPLHRITRRGLELTSMLFDQPQDAAVDPRFVHLLILSVSAFIPTAEPLLVELFGKGPASERKVDEYLRFVSQLLADRIQQGGRPEKRRG